MKKINIDPDKVIKVKPKMIKERIKKEFRESCNLPRKKKKRVRKNLQLEWSIANWNPFKF